MTANSPSTWLLSLALLAACSRSEDTLPDYSRITGELGSFVMDYAVRHGAHRVGTNALPTMRTEWRYKPDADGVQIHLRGDRLLEVQSLLLAAFGPPAIPARTNANGTVLAVYAAPTIGAAIQFGRARQDDGTSYTHILIVRKQALK
jgi:hypothetical protein